LFQACICFLCFVLAHLPQLREAVDLVAQRLDGLPRGEGQPGEGVFLLSVFSLRVSHFIQIQAFV
jgi:hypothetical protein